MDKTKASAVAALAMSVRRCGAELKAKQVIGFRYFPNGSCKRTSTILQHLLMDAGLGEWSHHHGENLPHGSHTWLELDGWYLDATLDQFDGYDEHIYLAVGQHPLRSKYPKVGVIPSDWIRDDDTMQAQLLDARAMLKRWGVQTPAQYPG